jgi:septum formation topological specificity factor MinE
MNEFKANIPFKFYTRLHLSELTGCQASSLKELLKMLEHISGSSIYHHTHRFLQQHQYLSPEPPNDFAYWVREHLGEEELGERLSSIDTIQFSSIRDLRNKIISTIKDYIKLNPKCLKKHSNQKFYFIKSVSFVLYTGYEAYNLNDFCEILSKITIDSIYYHIFESRLRLEKGKNDFSNWFENILKEKELAWEIEKLDPYTHTMEELRNTIIKIIKKRIKND